MTEVETSTAPRGPAASAGLLLALAVLLVLGLWRFAFTIDDAYISFRYARNWAESGVPTWTVGEAPVEGYSNFLWVLLLRVAYLLNLERLDLVARALGILFGAGTVVLLHRHLLRDLRTGPAVAGAGALMLAATPPFATWCSGGLETPLFGFLLLALHVLLVAPRAPGELRRGVLAGAVAVALALTRSEGFLWAVGLGACAWVGQRSLEPERRSAGPRWGAYLATYLAGFGLFLAWRHATYGAWVPNTVHAKAHLSGATLGRGLRCTASYLLLTVLPLAVAIAAHSALRRPHRHVALAALLTFLAGLLYNVGVGGDWMPYFRFLAPMSPFVALVLALGMSQLPGNAILGPTVLLLSLGGLSTTGEFDLQPWTRTLMEPLGFREFREGEYRSERRQLQRSRENVELFTAIGQGLREVARPGDSFVMGAIGAVGWYSGVDVLDRNGLVDAQVARLAPADEARSAGHDKRVPRTWFLDNRPTPPTFVQALIVPREALDRTSGAFRQGVQRCAAFIRAQDGDEALAQLVAVSVPEVHPLPSDCVLDPSLHALMLWRTTPDRAAAHAFWSDFGD